MSENIYAQININNVVDYVIDFEEQYGQDWRTAKKLFEQCNIRYVKVNDLTTYNAGDIFDEEKGCIITQPKIPEISKQTNNLEERKELSQKTHELFSDILMPRKSTKNNHSFLFFSTVSDGNIFLNYGVPLESNISNLFTSINPQFLNDGSFICNGICKTDYKIFFNKIYRISKDRKIIKEINIDNLHHECIYGSNLPRYYTPTFDYSTANTNYLVLINYNIINEEISNEMLLDDKVLELDDDGNVIWEWACANHFNEFNFTKEEKIDIKNNPNYFQNGLYGSGHDWMHLNSACCLGENKWYDAGDERFHPDNIICCSRNRSVIFIISKKTKNIVWLIKGTDIERPFALQHYAHLIPKGLAGEGNLLFFDNGSNDRDYSRIIELDPITLEIVFEFTDGFKSKTQGSVQKLVNGDYLIGDSEERRMIRVNKDGDVENRFIVWFEFYRAIRHPELWLTEYKYSEDEIAAIKKLGKEEVKPLTNHELDMYENYINQLIMYEEIKTNQLLLINK